MGAAYAGREYDHAVPKGWSWILMAKMVSGSGEGDVMMARCIWCKVAVWDYEISIRWLA